MVEIGGIKHHYLGNIDLLGRPKVSIVGSRRPNSYTRALTQRLAKSFVDHGNVVVSGGAMGVDALAHRGAGAANTICVLPCGIDLRYPAINAKLIDEIAKNGLVLSQFDPGFRATKWSFVVRNRTVVELGEFLVVTQADRNSGSMRSVEYALQKSRPIYVPPHRLGESEGTNELAQKGLAQVIWDLQMWQGDDEFVRYLKGMPTLEDAIERYGERIYEAEMEGLIRIEGTKIVYMGA